MMIRFLLVFFLTLFIAGCASDKPFPNQAHQDYLERDLPKAEKVVKKQGKVRPEIHYLCNDGVNDKKNVSVYFDKKALQMIILKTGEEVEVLHQVRSGSGARYVNAEGYEYWTKGPEALVSYADNRQYSCVEKDVIE